MAKQQRQRQTTTEEVEGERRLSSPFLSPSLLHSSREEMPNRQARRSWRVSAYSVPPLPLPRRENQKERERESEREREIWRELRFSKLCVFAFLLWLNRL